MSEYDERAIADTAPSIEAAYQLHSAGRLPEAEALYRQLLDHDPENVRALNLFGVLNYELGRNELAIDLLSRAVALNSGEPCFHSDLGLALQACGRVDEAIAAFQRALALNPEFVHAHYNQACDSAWKIDPC